MGDRRWALVLVIAVGAAACSRENPYYQDDQGASGSSTVGGSSTGAIRPVTATTRTSVDSVGQGSTGAVDTGPSTDTGMTDGATQGDTGNTLPDAVIMLYGSMPTTGDFWPGEPMTIPLNAADWICNQAPDLPIPCGVRWALMVQTGFPPAWYVDRFGGRVVVGPTGMPVAGDIAQLMSVGPTVDFVTAGIVEDEGQQLWTGIGPGPSIGQTCGFWNDFTQNGHAATVNFDPVVIPCGQARPILCMCTDPPVMR